MDLQSFLQLLGNLHECREISEEMFAQSSQADVAYDQRRFSR